MNSIFLVLALGGLEATGSRETPIAAASLPRVEYVRRDSLLVFQEIKWPKVDPRNSTKSKWDSAASNENGGAAKGGVPAIRRTQLDDETPNYDKKTPPATKPLVKAREASHEDPEEEETTRPAARSQVSGGSRYGRQQSDEEPASQTKPRFGESTKHDHSDRDAEFTSTPALKTSVRRQSSGERESAPDPLEFRPATISDDREEPERRAPFRSFAIGDGDPEDDLGVDPYSEPLGSNRRSNEYLASNSGTSRDSKFPANGDDDSTMQGGKRVPETNSNTMWGFAVVTLLLFASMGANAYLAWVAREFYERYRSLAQQVRASRNNMS